MIISGIKSNPLKIENGQLEQEEEVNVSGMEGRKEGAKLGRKERLKKRRGFCRDSSYFI